MNLNPIEPLRPIDATSSGRPLTQIESDLLKAEAAVADADRRVQDAQRDRVAAIAMINEHQAELDLAIDALRHRSVAGSRWRLDLEKREPAMMLHDQAAFDKALVLNSEQIFDIDSAAKRPGVVSASEEFDRLKLIVESAGNDSGPTRSKK